MGGDVSVKVFENCGFGAARRRRINIVYYYVGRSFYMCSDKDREIKQLWIVSKMYFEMAQSIKVPKKDLKLTVKKFADICKKNNGIENHMDLICASAHYDSCAVRLYAIDECIKSQRFKDYDNIRKCKSKKKIKNKITQNTEQYMHFLLRHMIAHCESKRLDFPKYKIAYEVMYDTYLDFQFCFIFEKLKSVMELIKSNINIE